MSMFTQWVPPRRAAGPHERTSTRTPTAWLTRVEEVAPGFTRSILTGR